MEIPIPGKMIFRAGAAIKHIVGCTRRLEDACECDKVFRARLREIIPANNTMQEQKQLYWGNWGFLDVTGAWYDSQCHQRPENKTMVQIARAIY